MAHEFWLTLHVASLQAPFELRMNRNMTSSYVSHSLLCSGTSCLNAEQSRTTLTFSRSIH
jgi:hypothetical protein